MSAEDLAAALTSRTAIVCEGDEEEEGADHVTMPLTVPEACDNRGALITTIHRILLQFLHARVEGAIDAATTSRGGFVISLVRMPSCQDAGGGLDDLCAQYCLERQRHFLLNALQQEPLDTSPSSSLLASAVAETTETVELFESVPSGLMPTIERHSRGLSSAIMGNGGDGDLCAALGASHGGNNSSRWRLTASSTFEVRHSTDDIGVDHASSTWRAYRANGLIRADKCAAGKPPYELTQLLRASASSILREAFLSNTRGPRSSAATISSSHCGKLRLDLSALFASLADADCRLVASIEMIREEGASVRSSQLHLLQQLRSLLPFAVASLPANASQHDTGAKSTRLPTLNDPIAASLFPSTSASQPAQPPQQHTTQSLTNPHPAPPTGGDSLIELMELRMWTPRGPVWSSFACTLLSDDNELLLLHSSHPPYSASFNAAMITSVRTLTEGGSKGSKRPTDTLAEDDEEEDQSPGGWPGYSPNTLPSPDEPRLLSIRIKRPRVNASASGRARTAKMGEDAQPACTQQLSGWWFCSDGGMEGCGEYTFA